MRMSWVYPEEYNFFPKTWVLPYEHLELRNHFAHNNLLATNKKVTYIVKPDSLSQGKGIFITRDIDKILAICLEGKHNEALESHPGNDNNKIGGPTGYVV